MVSGQWQLTTDKNTDIDLLIRHLLMAAARLPQAFESGGRAAKKIDE